MLETLGQRPDRAPKHPFWNPDYLSNRLLYAFGPSLKFLEWFLPAWEGRQGHLTPKQVAEEFNLILAELGISTEVCSLYDVWNVMTWYADSAAHLNLEENNPNRLDTSNEAQFDQMATLLEAAMNLAGHKPAEDLSK
jgi:hypothetical protein